MFSLALILFIGNVQCRSVLNGLESRRLPPRQRRLAWRHESLDPGGGKRERLRRAFVSKSSACCVLQMWCHARAYACLQQHACRGGLRGAGRGKADITVICVTGTGYGTGYGQCPVRGGPGPLLMKRLSEQWHSLGCQVRPAQLESPCKRFDRQDPEIVGHRDLGMPQHFHWTSVRHSFPCCYTITVTLYTLSPLTGDGFTSSVFLATVEV